MTRAFDFPTDTLHNRVLHAIHAAPRAAVVLIASKFRTESDLVRFRSDVSAALALPGWLPLLWLPTTAENRGADEACFAKAARVDVVLVARGDGTMRTVAQHLAGSPVALGLIPSGTGKLLARTLDVPSGRSMLLSRSPVSPAP